MASLQARHGRHCATGKAWTKPDELGECNCKPTYYVMVREGKKTIPQKVGQKREAAERAARKIGVAVDEGSWEAPKDISFSAWADLWIAGLKKPGRNTIRSYASTLTYAKDAFGGKSVRRIGHEDLKRLMDEFDEKKLDADGQLIRKPLSQSTQSKHLRVLGVCFNSAIKKGYTAHNPLARLEENERPQHHAKEAAWFEDDELALLLPALPEGVYRTLACVAVMTGLRQGELLALRWDDVDYDLNQLRIDESYTDGRLGPPKGRRNRLAHVSPK